MPNSTNSGFYAAAVAWSTGPLALRPVFYAAVAAWSTAPFAVAPVWMPDAALPENRAFIVLARQEDFVVVDGVPTHWKPARNGHFGTYHATRTLGFGTVLSISERRIAPTSVETDPVGLNLAGSVGDQTETVAVHCDITLLDPNDIPETSDLFFLGGKTFIIFQIETQSERDEGKEMTVTGIRWRGCTTLSTPEGFVAPAEWS